MEIDFSPRLSKPSTQLSLNHIAMVKGPVWISIEQSVMVSSIVYVFMGFVASDWSCAVEFTNNIWGGVLLGH